MESRSHPFSDLVDAFFFHQKYITVDIQRTQLFVCFGVAVGEESGIPEVVLLKSAGPHNLGCMHLHSHRTAAIVLVALSRFLMPLPELRVVSAAI